MIAAEVDSAARPVRASLEIGRWTLRAERVEGLPLVSTRVFVRGGSRLEPSPGWSHLVGRLLAEGTEKRDFHRLAEDAESRGAWQQTFGTGETIGVVVDTLSVDWRWALDHLLEILLEPAFPEQRLQWLCRQITAELESMADQPEVRTGLAFIDQIFAPHPYGRPVSGTPKSLEAITRQDCVDLHRRSLGWGGCLCVAGDIDPEAVLEHLEPRFQALDLPYVEAQQPPPAVGAEKRRLVELREAEQAHVFLGTTTVQRTHPDLAALELLGVVLGSGGLSGRFPQRLREDEGLAYQVDVATAAGAGVDAGRFAVYLGTSKRHVDKAEAMIREELDRLMAGSLTAEELEEARGYLLGRAPFRLETLRQRAELMAEAALYGTRVDDPEWWPEQLRAVELADLERVAREFLDPTRMRVTIGSPR